MTQSVNTSIETPSFAPRLYSIAAIVAAIVLIGLWLMSKYVALDQARDLRNWQEKLNLIAESRATDVTEYVSNHFSELRSLAQNPSLQLYLTEVQSLPESEKKSPAGEAPEPPAQLSYLRNLLVFSAERGGYSPPSNVANIPANVETDNKSGLAVLGSENQLVVSTVVPQSVRDIMIQNAKNVTNAQEALIDITKDEQGNIYMGFVVPIFAIQGDQNKESQVGTVVAIKQVDASFFGLLKHPGVIEKTLETVLVRGSEDRIEFLSPLLDKSGALSKQVDENTKNSAERTLMHTAGSFVADQKDYANKVVLGTSRSISGTPWTMVVKVERDEALRDSIRHRTSMVTFFLMMLAIIVLIIIAIWWHASSKRSLMMSYHFRRMAAESQAQEKLLRLVTDNQPEPIFILDGSGHYQFANRKAVDDVGMSPENVVGKAVKDVRGTAKAEHIIQHAHTASSMHQIGYHTFQDERDGVMQTIRGAYIPVEHIPVSSLPTPTPGVLIVEQDISEVVNEREKRLQINQDLIHTLVTLVDRRDPFAANHSMLVSGLAHSVAVHMELDGVTVETTRIAASLMNVGKIVIPTELLTKTDPLTDDERRIIRDSMVDAAELVRPIHFDGPVYDTLCQWQEKYDGSGVLKLKGDAILVSARILSVANTFIGMISPRSWRTAISNEEAVKFLMNNCDTLFDRRVVVALVHYMENQNGREWIRKLTQRPNAA